MVFLPHLGDRQSLSYPFSCHLVTYIKVLDGYFVHAGLCWYCRGRTAPGKPRCNEKETVMSKTHNRRPVLERLKLAVEIIRLVMDIVALVTSAINYNEPEMVEAVPT